MTYGMANVLFRSPPYVLKRDVRTQDGDGGDCHIAASWYLDHSGQRRDDADDRDDSRMGGTANARCRCIVGWISGRVLRRVCGCHA
jgi:hypothetical protein